MTWYLVFSMGVTYLGPMEKSECDMIRGAVKSATCQEARVMTMCSMPGHPEIGIACPAFTTLKNDKEK